jgi:MFS family permease
MTVILADDEFIEYHHVDANRTGTIAAVPWTSTGLAQLFVGSTLASIVGRLWALRIFMVIMMIGVVVQSVPNTYGILIYGRLLTGLGFGCVYIATSLYVAECSPRKLCGSFVGTVTQFGYQLGTLTAFWAGYGMSYVKEPFNVAWRVSNLIQLPIGLTFVVLSFWYPESPRWLLEKQPDNSERVLKILCNLRMGDEHSEHVLNEYNESADYDSTLPNNIITVVLLSLGEL